MKQYDFIFTGGGLATLLTLSELVKNKSCAAYSILVIDSEPKNTNDRTWCFWIQKILLMKSVIKIGIKFGLKQNTLKTYFQLHLIIIK